ncbi:hypothetical protein PoB_003671200 [Plakobranchus ocellatus]|uniref:Uncharacterized protein n=1 Tax=Plakobranchus ocellatus TaxID=259542 RepID=A0AAV4ASB4_9GAST|nr:hypothetical protein PoB_003671200 [Plakobranchus ocellatus]
MPSQLIDRRGLCYSARLIFRTEHVPRPKDLHPKEIQLHRRGFSQAIQDISSTVRPGFDTFLNQLTMLLERWLKSAELSFALPNSIVDLIIGNGSDLNDGPFELYIRPNKDDPVDVGSSKRRGLISSVSIRAATRAQEHRPGDSKVPNEMSVSKCSMDTLMFHPFTDMDANNFVTRT